MITGRVFQRIVGDRCDDMKLRQEDIAELRREIARLKTLEGGGR